MKRFAVTVVDYGESCDGKAEILQLFKTRKEAVRFVKKDIRQYAKSIDDPDKEVNYDNMSVRVGDYERGCEWDIQELDIDID